MQNLPLTKVPDLILIEGPGQPSPIAVLRVLFRPDPLQGGLRTEEMIHKASPPVEVVMKKPVEPLFLGPQFVVDRLGTAPPLFRRLRGGLDLPVIDLGATHQGIDQVEGLVPVVQFRHHPPQGRIDHKRDLRGGHHQVLAPVAVEVHGLHPDPTIFRLQNPVGDPLRLNQMAINRRPEMSQVESAENPVPVGAIDLPPPEFPIGLGQHGGDPLPVPDQRAADLFGGQSGLELLP